MPNVSPPFFAPSRNLRLVHVIQLPWRLLILSHYVEGGPTLFHKSVLHDFCYSCPVLFLNNIQKAIHTIKYIKIAKNCTLIYCRQKILHVRSTESNQLPCLPRCPQRPAWFFNYSIEKYFYVVVDKKPGKAPGGRKCWACPGRRGACSRHRSSPPRRGRRRTFLQWD